MVQRTSIQIPGWSWVVLLGQQSTCYAGGGITLSHLSQQNFATFTITIIKKNYHQQSEFHVDFDILSWCKAIHHFHSFQIAAIMAMDAWFCRHKSSEFGQIRLWFSENLNMTIIQYFTSPLSIDHLKKYIASSRKSFDSLCFSIILKHLIEYRI